MKESINENMEKRKDFCEEMDNYVNEKLKADGYGIEYIASTISKTQYREGDVFVIKGIIDGHNIFIRNVTDSEYGRVNEGFIDGFELNTEDARKLYDKLEDFLDAKDGWCLEFMYKELDEYIKITEDGAEEYRPLKAGLNKDENLKAKEILNKIKF